MPNERQWRWPGIAAVGTPPCLRNASGRFVMLGSTDQQIYVRGGPKTGQKNIGVAASRNRRTVQGASMMRKIRLNEWQTKGKRILKLVFWSQKQKGEGIDWCESKRNKVACNFASNANLFAMSSARCPIPRRHCSRWAAGAASRVSKGGRESGATEAIGVLTVR